MFEMIQKVNPKILPIDTCQASLNWLETYVQDWFKSYVPNHGEIWFADENTKGLGSHFPTGKKHVEVVLTGSFLIRILESKLWPFEECRFWVLSSRIKKILVETLKIPSDSIGVISRNTFEREISPINFSGPVNFIYAGRLSFAKNVTGLIRLVSCLQTQFQRDVSLDLFGESDDFPDESLGRYNPFEMKDLINALIAELKWTSPPIMHGKVSPKTWLSSKRERPVFVSLSTSMYEDFGVAAEEARQHGWPCLLSDWGGHQECFTSYLIPYHLIPQTHQPSFIQEIKTEQLAKYLLGAENITISKAQPEIEAHMPCILKRTEYQTIVDRLISDWGQEILFCLREKMSFFADTPKGMELFNQYHRGMGKKQSNIAMIVNDLKKNPELHLMMDEPFDVIYMRELFAKHTIFDLLQYNAFYLCGLDSELNVVSSFIRNCVGHDANIRIFPQQYEVEKTL